MKDNSVRIVKTVAAVALLIGLFVRSASAVGGIDPQPSTPYSYADVGDSRLAGEIDDLRLRGGTDATGLNVVSYSSWHYFSPKTDVRREEFFGMLGRAFHVTPSWGPSPFPDYRPNDATGSLANWFAGDEKPLKQVVLRSNANASYQLNLLRRYVNAQGKMYFRWEQMENGAVLPGSPKTVNLPAETYAVNVVNWNSGAALYVDRIVYSDGSSEDIAAAVPYGTSRASLRIFPRIDSYYPWVVGAANIGWVQGYSDGLFRPDNTMTRLEAMVTMTRAMGYSDFARMLTDEQVNSVLSRFSDSYLIPPNLRAEVAVLVITGVTRGYAEGILGPTYLTLREHAAAFIQRASRVLVEPVPYKWSPDGDGHNETAYFRIEPGWPHRLSVSYPWYLNLYRLPENSGWTQYVGQVSGTTTVSDQGRNYLLASWSPSSLPPAGIYMAEALIYSENPYAQSTYARQFPSPLAPFEVVYHTLGASASPTRVRAGQSVTVQALTTGGASQVTVAVPTEGGGRQTFQMGNRGFAGKHSFYGDQYRWEFVWVTPTGLAPGRYDLEVTAYYADGAPPRKATVVVDIYEPFTPRCIPLENPVWTEPSRAVTVGCTDTTSGGQVVSGSASVAGRSYALAQQPGRIWTAQVTAPSAPGSYNVTLVLQVQESGGSRVTHSVPLTLVVVPRGQAPGQGMEFFGPLPGVPGRVRLIE